jgi:hypothetical protein
MRKTMTAATVVAITAAMLATVAGARPASAKQRVSIAQQGRSFVLTPASAGAIRSDRGGFAACCWSTREVTVAGQRLDLNDPKLTFTGRHGTLRFRNRIVWVDVPDRWSLFTGTWKAIGGTGAYAGLSGSGHVAGVQTPSGYDRVQFFGFLTSK